MGKISKSGIGPLQQIKSEHLIRIIDALSGETPDTQIEISGPVTASYFVGDGSKLTNLPSGSGGGGSGSINLNYIPSPTSGTIENSTGTNAIIPLADVTNAGLLSPAGKVILDNYSSDLDLKADQATTYTKIEVDGLVSSTYKPQGSVANYASLPTTGQLEGYVWNVLDTGDNYVWVLNLNNTGTPGWDKLSGTVDLSAYETKVVAESKYLQITNVGTAVLSVVLTGLSLVTGTPINSVDTVISAFGKIQKQINDISLLVGTGFKGSNFIRVNGNYTFLQADSGKYILISGNGRTITIPDGLTGEFHITLDIEGTGALIVDSTTTMYGDNSGLDNGTANNYNIPQNGSFYFIRNTVDGRIRTKGDYI